MWKATKRPLRQPTTISALQVDGERICRGAEKCQVFASHLENTFHLNDNDNEFTRTIVECVTADKS